MFVGVLTDSRLQKLECFIVDVAHPFIALVASKLRQSHNVATTALAQNQGNTYVSLDFTKQNHEHNVLTHIERLEGVHVCVVACFVEGVHVCVVACFVASIRRNKHRSKK